MAGASVSPGLQAEWKGLEGRASEEVFGVCRSSASGAVVIECDCNQH